MVKWISSTSLAVRWLTRPQSQSALTICEATTGACLEQEEPLFSQDGSTFFLTLPVKQGARGEFQHIALLSTQIHPDEGHALQSDRSRQHLIRTLVRYFLGCLQNPRRRSSERQEDEY
ncbi:UNVERIFIED_CONTAM: hypothetical protein FKN15_045968 [Acipenser sinensis]